MTTFAMFKNITNLKTNPRNFSLSEKAEANSTHRRNVASRKSCYLKIEHFTIFFRVESPCKSAILQINTLPLLFCRAVFLVTPFQPFLSTLKFLNIQDGVCRLDCYVGRVRYAGTLSSKCYRPGIVTLGFCWWKRWCRKDNL